MSLNGPGPGTSIPMSWNESGGNKNSGPKNPWDRKPDSGPRDLDDMVRGLKKRLASLLGRRGRAAGNGNGGATSIRIGYVVAVAVGVWLASGVYIVGPAEQAVVTRFGRFVGVVADGTHWHLPWPIEAQQIVNTQEFLSFTDRTRMLTQDAALVDIKMSVQYRRTDARAFVFNIVEPERTLGEAAESAIRESVGQSQLEFVLEKGRQDITQRTKQLIQHTLDGYKAGLEIISVNLEDVNVPEQVANSQKDAIKAREDKDRIRVEADTYSNKLLPRARGDAQRQLLDAEAYRQQVVAQAEGESSRFAQLLAAYEKAPAVTRQRLYIETMERVYGNAPKVIVDVKGTGNTIYLPLDKLLERRSQDLAHAQAPTLPEVTVTPQHADADAATDARSRARDNR